MIQIRNSVFETNSSSTHSMAIPRKIGNYDGQSIDFCIGDYGWEFDEVDPADYFYTAICNMSPDENGYLIFKFKEILEKHNIKATFEKPTYNKTWLVNGYIDHCGELQDFINMLITNEDLLLTFIFDGVVFTANDNDDNEGFLNRNEKTLKEYDYVSDGYSEIIETENKYYDPKYEEYDWYFKGN